MMGTRSIDPLREGGLRPGRPIVFGEVLFDRFPDGSVVLGGAPFNVAWHLQAFGRAPLLITRVGDDALGERARAAMAEWGLDTSGVQVDPARPTGTVEVALTDDGPRFHIRDDVAYDGLDAEALPDTTDGALLYHGTLALRGPSSRRAFDRLAAAANVPRFLDVNLRAPWWRRDDVAAHMHGADWIKLNDEEYALLGDAAASAAEARRGGGDGGGDSGLRTQPLAGGEPHRASPAGARGDDSDLATPRRAPEADPAELLSSCELRLLVLTRGARGAELITPGERRFAAPPASGKVVDAVGAGDGFASVVLLGLLEGWPLATMLHRAQAFASALVGVRGAIVRDRGFYESALASWSNAG